VTVRDDAVVDGRIGRRRFLLAVGGTAAAFVLTGCGSSADPAPAAESVDPEQAPAAPELASHVPKYVRDARAYLVTVPPALVHRAMALVPEEARDGLNQRLLALSDVCPRDRIQLQRCSSSGFFECPACGSFFDALGDKSSGPAPAGMWFHRVIVENGEVSIVGSPRYAGLPVGTRLVQQAAAGPHCQ
jgi:hypothetical protein